MITAAAANTQRPQLNRARKAKRNLRPPLIRSGHHKNAATSAKIDKNASVTPRMPIAHFWESCPTQCPDPTPAW